MVFSRCHVVSEGKGVGGVKLIIGRRTSAIVRKLVRFISHPTAAGTIFGATKLHTDCTTLRFLCRLTSSAKPKTGNLLQHKLYEAHTLGVKLPNACCFQNRSCRQ